MPDLEPIVDIHKRIENEEKFTEEIKEDFKHFVSDNYYDIDYGPSAVTLDKFSVRRFNNISKANVELEGEDYIIYGKNSLGKTSLLRAIQYNLLGLPENKQKYGMTDIIQTGKARMYTEGKWDIDQSKTLIHRELYRKGRGGALYGQDKPIVTEGADSSELPEDRHDQPETVFRKIGIAPLYNRDYSAYEFMSLFFLMSRDFLNFINWKGNSSEVIDIIFGIYLTNVSNAVKNRLEKVDDLSDHIESSPQNYKKYQSKLQSTRADIEILKEEEEKTKNQIVDKVENLESLRIGEDSEQRLNHLRSHRSSLRSKLADLKSERTEAISELAEVRRTIKRYKDNDLSDEVKDIADELHDLLTVPDRCPICMNNVDAEQRHQLREDHRCPLCSKEMPQDRIQEEKEYQVPNSLNERREQQEQEIEELEENEQALEGQISQLESRIVTTEEDLEEVEQRLEENNLSQELERREELEDEIRDLRQKAVDIQVQIDSLQTNIEYLEREVKAQEHLKEIKSEYTDKKTNLSRLAGIIDIERKNQRRKLQQELKSRMESIIGHLSEGFFSDATAVSFDNASNYHFTIHTPSRRYESSKAEKDSAEATLQSIIFHSSVLKHLSETQTNSVPIRLFVIDSPFSEDMDPGNMSDLTSLISYLPEYLDKYQTVVTMAKQDEERMNQLKKSEYTITNIRHI